MAKERGEGRQAELQAMRQDDPVALLSLYQQGSDLDQLAREPGGITFATMIAAILEREERGRGNGNGR